MTARELADLILTIHFAYAAGVVLPVPIVLLGWSRGWSLAHSNWFRTLNLVLVIPVLLETLMRARCPLTLLGNRFRVAAGEPPYREGCVNYWLGRVLGHGFPPWLLSALASLVALSVPVLYWEMPPPWLALRRSRRNVDRSWN